MDMVKCLLLLSTLLASGYPWIVTTTHPNVIPDLTDDVTLRCFCKNPNEAKPAIEQITRIRLLKMDDAINWSTFAEVVVPDNSKAELSEPNLPGVHASGQLGEVNQSFLSVTWSTASDDTPGTYKCEVDGFAFHQGTNTHISTAIVNITNNEVTVRDLLTVAVQMKHKANVIYKGLQDIKAESVLQHRELISNMLMEINSSVENNYFEARYWPSGIYALLAPDTGCPDTSFQQLMNGSITIQSESNKVPKHKFSSPNHIGKNIFEKCGTRNILKPRFCTNIEKEPRLLWPPGSYCIHHSNGCPTNFRHGYVTLYLESSTNLVVSTDYALDPLSFDLEAKKWFMNLCCRADGNTDMPMILPFEKPFYLYRFKGKCQSVFNMDVTNEWLQIDTDATKRNTYNNEFHADVDISSGRFELCYYTRKKKNQLIYKRVDT